MMTLQSSYIYLKKLRFHAYHGVLPQELLTGNDYEVNIRLKYSIAAAMQTDHLDDTLSYADVFNTVKQEMNKPSKLLEHVAGRMVDHILRAYPQVEAIDLDITKINPPMGAYCDGAGVEIHIINKKTE